MKNCRSNLRRKRARPMSRYDALPSELRLWLQQATLPWSVTKTERLWQSRLKQNGGDAQDALAWLNKIEMKTLAKDSIGLN